MYPSSFSTLAIASLTLDVGIWTVAFSASCALRIRVSMSAIGSVMLMYSPQPHSLSWVNQSIALPACLDDAGDLSAHGDLAKLVAPQPEFAVHASRTAGQLAAIAQSRRAGVARKLLQLVPRSKPSLLGKPGVVDGPNQLGAL